MEGSWSTDVFILQGPLVGLAGPSHRRVTVSILWSEKCVAWVLNEHTPRPGESKNMSIIEEAEPEGLTHV